MHTAPHSKTARLELDVGPQREARAVGVDQPAGARADRGARRLGLGLRDVAPQAALIGGRGGAERALSRGRPRWKRKGLASRRNQLLNQAPPLTGGSAPSRFACLGLHAQSRGATARGRAPRRPASMQGDGGGPREVCEQVGDARQAPWRRDRGVPGSAAARALPPSLACPQGDQRFGWARPAREGGRGSPSNSAKLTVNTVKMLPLNQCKPHLEEHLAHVVDVVELGRLDAPVRLPACAAEEGGGGIPIKERAKEERRVRTGRQPGGGCPLPRSTAVKGPARLPSSHKHTADQ